MSLGYLKRKKIIEIHKIILFIHNFSDADSYMIFIINIFF